MKRKKLKLIGISLFATISLFSCKDEEHTQSIETKQINFEKEGELYLIKPAGDTLKKLDIEFAETAYERATGLMYREGMQINQGMLFIYGAAAPRSFYMKNTYFPLDIIYFDADSLLVSIQKEAVPKDETSLPSEGPAKFILEVNGGLSDEWNLEKGDKINFSKLK